MTDNEFKYIGDGLFKNKFELTVLRLLWIIAVRHSADRFNDKSTYLHRLEKDLFE